MARHGSPGRSMASASVTNPQNGSEFVDPVTQNFGVLHGAGSAPIDYGNPAGPQWDMYEKLMNAKNVQYAQPKSITTNDISSNPTWWLKGMQPESADEANGMLPMSMKGLYAATSKGKS